MTIKTPIHSRFARSLACGLAAAAVVVPAAIADPPQGRRAPPSDVVDRYLANDRAHAAPAAGTADVIERYVESRARITGLTSEGYQPRRRGHPNAVAASQSFSDGFSWGDASIGAAFGFVVSLIAGGALLATRGRQRTVHS